MLIPARTFWAALLCCSALLPGAVQAEGIDTEHIFAFMIGADVGDVGDRELQSQTTGRFAKNDGRYRALEQEIELEFVPTQNFRIELGGGFSAHDISGVPDFEDRRQLALQGVSLDLRYKVLDRQLSPFGLTFAAVGHADRIDEATAAVVRSYGTDLTVAFDRDLIPNFVIGALNLSYQPEWTRVVATGAAEQDSTIGAAFAVMAQVRPGFLLGGEARYLRRYEGIGLDQLSGQALFIGPTAYFQLSERSRLTVAWSAQAWGRSEQSPYAALDLVNFERHQARVVFGVNF
jgi:hypothetical protein